MSLSNLIRRKSEPVGFATATPATFATLEGGKGGTVASVATVAVAKSPQGQTAPLPKVGRASVQRAREALDSGSPELVDMSPGWREREAIAAWRQTWGRLAKEWRAYVAHHPDWQPPSPHEARCRLAEMVHAWNRCTGQQRDPAEVLDRLAPEDYQDAELLTPGCLGLLVALFLEPAP